MKADIEYDGVHYRVPLGFWWRYRRRAILRCIRHYLLLPFEWMGILVGLVVLSNLPRRLMFELCDIVSFIYYTFDRGGRRLAVKNLAVMFPDGCGGVPRRDRLIIRRAYRNMCRTIGYAFWTFRSARRRCADAGELSPVVRDFIAVNRPAVTVSGHIGCWEILSQLAFLSGHTMMSVAKDIGTSGMTRLLMRARRSIGQEIVRAEGAFKPLMAGIKAGKSLGLLVDQIVEPHDGGVAIRFFGRDYYASPAPAFFAAKAKVPIVVAWSRPIDGGRYRCEPIDVISSAEARDIRGTTQRIASGLERVIRRHPSCWVLNYDYFREVWSAERERQDKERYHAMFARAAKGERNG